MTATLSESTRLAAICEEIYRAGDRVGEIAERLEVHADRLHGPEPKPECDKAPPPSAGGLLGDIEQNLNCLFAALSRADEQASRNMIG